MNQHRARALHGETDPTQLTRSTSTGRGASAMRGKLGPQKVTTRMQRRAANLEHQEAKHREQIEAAKGLAS